MRRGLAVALASLAVLAACGESSEFSGDAKANFDICRENGGDAPYCSCVTRALQASMSPEAFSAMAKRDQADLEGVLAAISAADASCKAE
jgi:hypothetical protein